MSDLRRVLTGLPVTELAIIAVGFGLRLVLLGDANIWSDEGLSVWAARQSLDASALYTAGDVHPPLYFWLLHYWLGASGSSEFAVRLLSVFAGVAVIPCAGWLCRLLTPNAPWISRLAMLLVATSRFGVWWSQEARMYIFGALFATVSLGLAVRLRWRPNRWLALAYVAAAAAGLWTLYLTVFSLAIQGLYWLWSLSASPTWRERLRLAALWAILQLAALAVFFPWLGFTLPRLPAWSRAVTFDPRLFLEIYASLVTTGVSVNVESMRPIVLAVAVVLAVGLVALSYGRHRPWLILPGAVLLLGLILLVPPIGVWLVTTMPRSFGKPEARYLIPFAPSVYVVLAIAVASVAALAGRTRALAGVALAAGLMLVSGWSLAGYWSGRYLADEYKSVALTLRAYVQPGDVVVLHTLNTWPAFAYEWGRPFVSTPATDSQDKASADDFLAPLWAGNQGVWLAVNENALESDPRAFVETWLEERAAAAREWRFGNRRLRFFARSTDRAAAADSLAFPISSQDDLLAAISAGGGIAGWEQPLHRVRAGEVAQVFAYVGTDAAGRSLNVWLAERPSVAAQAPVPPGIGIKRVAVSVLVPADTPGGFMHWAASVGGVGQPVGSCEIVALPANVEAAAPAQHSVQALFGDPAIVRLEGYDLDAATEPGGALRLTLHWRAVGIVQKSYKVFVHLTDASGKLAAQSDAFPRQGQRPTTSWRPGEPLSDEYVVQIPGSISKGPYRLIVGLYDPATGVRLGPVNDGQGTKQPQDQLILAEVDIR